MKYIKSYESKSKPQIGDYVKIRSLGQDITPFKIFLDNNIGKIKDINKKNVYVHYEYVPDNFKLSFPKDSRVFLSSQISEFSKNKEDIELIISANKYNI